jgi:hypothetical protein
MDRIERRSLGESQGYAPEPSSANRAYPFSDIPDEDEDDKDADPPVSAGDDDEEAEEEEEEDEE